MRRRDLFKAAAGLLGVAVVGRDVATPVPANMPNGGYAQSFTVASGASIDTSLFARTYTASSDVRILNTVYIPEQKAIRVDIYFKDLKRGNPRKQMWSKI